MSEGKGKLNISFWLPVEIFERIRTRAFEERTSLSELLRRMVLEYLDLNEKKDTHQEMRNPSKKLSN
jgi:hypothetical protein